MENLKNFAKTLMFYLSRVCDAKKKKKKAKTNAKNGLVGTKPKGTAQPTAPLTACF